MASGHKRKPPNPRRDSRTHIPYLGTVFERCIHCRIRDPLNMDHVVQRSPRDDAQSNMELLCANCHYYKHVAAHFLPTEHFARIRRSWEWWHAEQRHLLELVKDENIIEIAKRVALPHYMTLAVHCKAHEELCKFFWETVLGREKSGDQGRGEPRLSSEEERFARAQIYACLVSLYDRSNELRRADECLRRVAQMCTELHVPESHPILVRNRVDRAHWCNKRNTPQDIRLAGRILSGMYGPVAPAEDELLNRMQFCFRTRNHEATMESFRAVQAGPPQQLGYASTAYEIIAASCVQEAERQYRGRSVYSEQQKHGLLDAAVTYDETVLRKAVMAQMPRIVYLRNRNLVRSLICRGDLDRAAQVALFADCFRYAGTGTIPVEDACLDESTLREHVWKRKLIRTIARRYEYVFAILNQNACY